MFFYKIGLLLLYRLWKINQSHGAKIKGYTVLEADSEHIKIGCHYIAKSEIDLIEKELNWDGEK
jgi:hypothetical protein